MSCPMSGAEPESRSASAESCPEKDPRSAKASSERPPEPRHGLPPGPPPTPILGWRANALNFFRDPIRYMEDIRERYGDVVRLVDGPSDPVLFKAPVDGATTIFGFGPECNEEVLTQPEIFSGGHLKAPPTCEWINKSMMSLPNDLRGPRRALMLPAFTRGHMQNFYEEMRRQVDIMLDEWQEKGSANLVSELYDLSTSIASRCLYGQEASAHGDHFAATVRQFAGLLFSPVAAIRINLPGSPYRRLVRLGEKLRDQLARELRAKQEAGGEQTDVLAVMLGEGASALDADELLGEAVALFFAGHDVPANSAVFTLMLLTQHEEVMSRLVAEIDEVLGERSPDYKEIWRLRYLDAVFKESLRILGPALLIVRQAKARTTLRGYDVPEGSEVILSPYINHLDPRLFDDPKRFDPDRWASIKPSHYEYLPFGHGVRRCLGAGFAEIEIKLFLVRALQRFRFEPHEGAKLDFSCTIAINPKGTWEVDVLPKDGRYGESHTRLEGDFAERIDFR